MFKFRNFLMVSMFLVIGLLLFGCKSKSTVTLNSVFPADTDFAFVFDYSDEGQRENFKELIGRFPDTGLGKLIMAQVIPEMERNIGISFENDFKPVFEKPWKVGVAINGADENEQNDEGSPALRTFIESMEIYLAFQVEEDDKFKDLILKIDEGAKKRGKEITYKEDGDVEYWTFNEGGAVVRYRDVFVVVMRQEDVSGAVERLRNGKGGLNDSEDFRAVSRQMKDNLGYVYLDFEKFSDLLVEDFYGYAVDADFLKTLKTVYLSWSAEDDGFKFIGEAPVDLKNSDLEKILPNREYVVSLVDKINGEGVFLYVEQSSFEETFKSVVQGFMLGYAGIDPAGGDIFATADYYEQFLENFNKKADLKAGQVDKLLNSPFAFVMSWLGEEKILPTLSLYLQLEESEVEYAKKILAVLDQDVEELLVEFDKLIVESGGGQGAIRKDMEVVNGGALRKLYLDWNALDNKGVGEFLSIVGLDVEKFSTEFFYGLTGDNVLVFGFFPDFVEFYGKDVVAKNKNFKKALKSIGGDDWYAVSYIDIEPIALFYEKMMKMVKANLSTEEMGEFNVNYGFVLDKVADFMKTLGYMAEVVVFEDEVIRTTGFVEIKERK